MLSASADNSNLVFTSSNSTSASVSDPTTLAISPNSLTVNPGASNTFTITVTDSSASPTTPTGTIQLNDNGAGGTFSPVSCTLSSGSCEVSYAASANPPSTITITASYGGDSVHSASAGTSILTVNQLDHTSTTISPTSAVLPSNNTLTFSVQVTDTSSSPKVLAGTITFNDGHNGGTFNPTSCALPVPTCVTTYASPANPLNVITVNATYSGDSTHSASFAISQISTSTNSTTVHGANGPDPTVTAVRANTSTITPGGKVDITATVTDSSNLSSSMIGIMSWSDGGAGGVFTPNNCLLVSNQCALTYTAPSNPASSITITAAYGGDSGHLGSSGTALLSAAATSSSATTSPVTTPQPSTTQPSTTQPSTSTTPSTTTSPATTQTPQLSTSSTTPPPTTQPSTSTTPSTTKNPATAQVAQPSTTQPSTTPPSTSTTPSTTSPATSQVKPSPIPIRQVINAPESIFDKIISMIESIFKKI
ncbi:MAG TPA: Ig-like domain repeat protein [Candidatus Nitrosotalea sp.]|nr:Ig-like domain repeat protein [Candidatus Nitrosotalea sp.]